MDDDIGTQSLRRQDSIGQSVFGISDADYSGFGAELLGQLRGHQIDLVIDGHGGEHIHLSGSGLAQLPQAGAGAHHHQHVELLGNPPGPPRVELDHGDIVAVLEQSLGEGEADAARAHDADVHGDRNRWLD